MTEVKIVTTIAAATIGFLLWRLRILPHVQELIVHDRTVDASPGFVHAVLRAKSTSEALLR